MTDIQVSHICEAIAIGFFTLQVQIAIAWFMICRAIRGAV